MTGKLGIDSQGTRRIQAGIEMALHLGGLTSQNPAAEGVRFTWFTTKKLKIGDRVTVHILEDDRADQAL